MGFASINRKGFIQVLLAAIVAAATGLMFVLGTTSKISSGLSRQGESIGDSKEELVYYISANRENIAKEVATDCNEYVSGMTVLYIKYIDDMPIEDSYDDFSDDFVRISTSDISGNLLCDVMRKQYDTFFSRVYYDEEFVDDLDVRVSQSIASQ